MKKVKMINNVKQRKRRKEYVVTDRYAEALVKAKQATFVEKEEKKKPETKEEKPKAKTITKAVS